MDCSIDFSPSYSVLTAVLAPGESVLAEPGAMVAQQDVELRTRVRGGPLRGLRRAMGGESFFLNRFTGGAGGGWVMLAPPAPGDIGERWLLPGDELLVQSGSFLGCGETVELSSDFQGLRGLLAGEGFFFLKATVREQPGSVFFNACGAMREIPLHPGGELVVDTGHLVAMTGAVDYSIGRVGGLRSLVGGGEGLVTKLRGEGSVWVQTRNITALADWVSSMLPRPPRRGGKG